MKSPMRTGEAVFYCTILFVNQDAYSVFFICFSVTAQRARPERGEVVRAQRHIFVVPQGERGSAIFYIRIPRLGQLQDIV